MASVIDGRKQACSTYGDDWSGCLSPSQGPLESRAISQFDRLVADGQLLWRDSEPRFLCGSFVNFEFRVAPTLTSKKFDNEQNKPVLDAFKDEDPDFSLGDAGPYHRLILNKFCVVRPQFLIITKTFEPQRDPLNERDFSAVWNILLDLGDRYYALFNGGPAGGSSVGHKHLQIIPRSTYCDRGLLNGKRAPDRPTLPFRYARKKVDAGMSGEQLCNIYKDLLVKISVNSYSAHNMILTHQWLSVIPRPTAHLAGKNGADITCSAASMTGMIWCSSEEQYKGWLSYGPERALSRFGDLQPDSWAYSIVFDSSEGS